MDIIKAVSSNPLLLNHRWYKSYTLRAAKKHALGHSHKEMAISIETTLSCNSRCLMCYHGYKEMTGTMSMDLFKKIIDDCCANQINNVGLSVYGEPLMDKYLFERIRYLRKLNMDYGFFTNGHLLDIETANVLFELGGLKRINFSVCGYSPETYERIMPGLKRDVTYKNIIDFLYLKEKYKRKDTEVIVSTVKLYLNQHEIKRFVKFWQGQRGVNQVLTADLWNRVGNMNIDDINRLGRPEKEGNWLAPCKQLWWMFYVYYDGMVSPCCNDNDKRELIIGDMNKESLYQVSTGERLQYIRKIHLEDKRKFHPICGRCYYNCVWL